MALVAFVFTTVASVAKGGLSDAVAALPSPSPPTSIDVFSNPLEVSMGDPQILHDGDMYYVYGTTYDQQGFEVWSSSDLVHWRKHGFCWQKNSATWAQWFLWAPEAFRIGDAYYLFYTGAASGDPRLRVCVATSDSPLGPFVDLQAPLVGMNQVNHFDPSVYHDPDTDETYLYYTVDTTQSGSNTSQIRAVRLGSDLKTLDGPSTVCLVGDQDWEFIAGQNKYFIEGPYVIRVGGVYYMQYSGNAWNTPQYGVGYATATSPMGPWTKHEGNPILRARPGVPGPGHGCFVQSPDRSEWFIVYHSLLTDTSWRREVNIDRIGFFEAPSGPPRLALFGETTRIPQLLPSGARAWPSGVEDEFTAPIDRGLWRIVNEDPNRWTVANNQLVIRSQYGDIQDGRNDGRNLFLQYAPSGDFAVETSVTFRPQSNNERAGLFVWQSQTNYLFVGPTYIHGFGLDAPYLVAALKLNGTRHQVLLDNPRPDGPLHLRLARTNERYQAFYSLDGNAWTPIGAPVELPWPGPLQTGVAAFAPNLSLGRYAYFDHFRYPTAAWTPPGQSDEFDDDALDRRRWTLHHEDPDNWTLEDETVVITTAQGDFWRFRNDARNLFLQRAPDEDFRVETRIDMTPLANYEQAMLVVWQDHNHFLKLSTVHDNGLRLEAAREINGVYINTTLANPYGSQLVLAIEKKDGHYRFQASDDGETWIDVGDGYDDPFDPESGVPLRIGFGAIAPASGAARPARFEWFRVTPPLSVAGMTTWIYF